MTIHKRRGSGYGLYRLGIGVGLIGLVLVVVLGASGRLTIDWTRTVLSVGAALAVLAVIALISRR